MYKDFSDEYLRKEYKPDISMYKYAIKNYDLDPDVFEQDDSVLSQKEKLQKELFMRAFEEVKESNLNKEQIKK